MARTETSIQYSASPVARGDEVDPECLSDGRVGDGE